MQFSIALKLQKILKSIEVKSKHRVTERDEKGLCALNQDIPLERKILICRESYPRMSDSATEVMPIDHFLEQLWDGEIVK